MKHIILLFLFVIAPVSYAEDTTNKQEDTNVDRSVNLNFNLGPLTGEDVHLTGEDVYIMLNNKRHSGLHIASIEKGQLTGTGLVIADFEKLQPYLKSDSARISIQTASGKTISNRVSIKYLSSLDNLIFLEPEYNLQVLEQEVTTVQKKYEKAQKA